MRKFLYAVLAILLIATPVLAISIPTTEQVFNDTGEEAVWLMTVYNNEGATLDVGDVVVWDIGSSTGDNDYYVKKVSETDTYAVAGVVYGKDIASTSNGIIAVKGIVDIDVTGANVVTGSLLCTSNTGENGFATVCSDYSGDVNAFGMALSTATAGSPNGETAKAYLFGQ